jgi:phage portal protein BeeE
MEVALREEARAKGLPEEMINKLIPITSNKSSTMATSTSNDNTVATPVTTSTNQRTAKEIRSKLGYLNTGDAIRITAELDRIKAKRIISLWNSKDITDTKFVVNDYQLKSKTNIDAIKLKLDDVGYDYQKVFIGALIFATIFGVSSSFVGGEFGFILGFLNFEFT